MCLFIAWIYLQVYFLGITSFWRRRRDEGDEKGQSIHDILKVYGTCSLSLVHRFAKPSIPVYLFNVEINANVI